MLDMCLCFGCGGVGGCRWGVGSGFYLSHVSGPISFLEIDVGSVLGRR